LTLRVNFLAVMHSFLIAALAYGFLVIHGTSAQVTPVVHPLSGPCVTNAAGQNICSGSGSWIVLTSTGGGRAKAYCQIAMWPSGKGDVWESRVTLNIDGVCSLHWAKPNVLDVTIKN
jgi:hypothetical protein